MPAADFASVLAGVAAVDAVVMASVAGFAAVSLAAVGAVDAVSFFSSLQAASTRATVAMAAPLSRRLVRFIAEADMI
ncbi:hypothetical protein PWG15_02890 [Ensifer adhaerens]|nr:hypothetical protein [Ensifer adhaerens]WDZ79034.1 hypothetical protein PWG15_02890 [Ensifer adhaerens]